MAVLHSFECFIVDVADLALVSAELMECSYNGGSASLYIGRLRLHRPGIARIYLKKAVCFSLRLRAGPPVFACCAYVV